jgi:hypothetical protein
MGYALCSLVNMADAHRSVWAQVVHLPRGRTATWEIESAERHNRKLASDCLDVRELRRKGLFGGDCPADAEMARHRADASGPIRDPARPSKPRALPRNSNLMDKPTFRRRAAVVPLSSLREARG